ncbi:glycosyltransferase [Pelagibius sp. 7325]|uniref:glycosyltransferase n=1 Tax=Pelagibius sp. 7325 TaxID=3131994 RepID=UPI0030EBAD4E
MRKIFILVPSFSPTGPVKGAVALANALATERPTTLVAVKPGPGVEAPINPAVAVRTLGGGVRAVRAYRAMLEEAGGRSSVASISYCLSADAVNLMCRRAAVTCSSVRGNLPRNYRMDYGPKGLPLALAHLTALRGLDHVAAMTASMARQVAPFCGQMPVVIGNFIDEPAVERFRATEARAGEWRFAFVGSLSRRKQAHLVLHAAAALLSAGHDVRVDLIGEGPLRADLQAEIRSLGLGDRAVLHGHLAEPWPLLAAADAMVLPSLSEGMSRAVLEALHLGVPCVLRNVDGNAEVVTPGVNGTLFTDDAECAAAMERAAILSRSLPPGRKSLLPANCRQSEAARRMLALVETGHGAAAEAAETEIRKA